MRVKQLAVVLNARRLLFEKSQNFDANVADEAADDLAHERDNAERDQDVLFAVLLEPRGNQASDSHEQAGTQHPGAHDDGPSHVRVLDQRRAWTTHADDDDVKRERERQKTFDKNPPYWQNVGPDREEY